MSFLNRLTSLSSVRICQTVRHQFRQQIAKSVKHQQKSATPLSSLIVVQQRLYSTLQPELKTKLDKLVKQHKIVLFMKGDKDSPKCGFSNVITQVSSLKILKLIALIEDLVRSNLMLINANAPVFLSSISIGL